MLITVSGLSGVGKSTAAERLGGRLGIEAVDTGRIFRRLAARRGISVVELGRLALNDPQIDRELDQAMVRRARRSGDLILQGRLAGWMTHRYGIKAVRIWLGARVQTRAKRVAQREKIPYRQALRQVSERDRRDRKRYRRLYGIDLKDLGIYDTVVQTDNRSVEQVVSVIIRELEKIWPKIRQRRKPRSSRTSLKPVRRKVTRPRKSGPKRPEKRRSRPERSQKRTRRTPKRR